MFGEMIQFDEHIFQLDWFNHQQGADGNGFTPLHVCCARPPDSNDGLSLAKLLVEEMLRRKRTKF